MDSTVKLTICDLGGVTVKREQRNHEKDWEELWKDIVLNEDGSINLDQLKKELSDYAFMLDEVPKVYSHIANLSYPNYYASVIIAEADDKYQELHGDIIREDIGRIINDVGLNYEELVFAILEYISKY